jgi:hypothetical protein
LDETNAPVPVSPNLVVAGQRVAVGPHSLRTDSKGSGWGGRERLLLFVLLSGLQAVVQYADQAVEQVALRGGVAFVGLAEAVVVGERPARR